MFPPKSQRRFWTPQLHRSNSFAGRHGVPHAADPSLSTFRDIYTWGLQQQQHQQHNNIQSRLPFENGINNEGPPREAYCTVEEIQLGKRQPRSPVMSMATHCGAGSVRSAVDDHHARRKSSETNEEELEDDEDDEEDEKEAEAEEENHYEDGDESDEGENAGTRSRRSPTTCKAMPMKSLPPSVPPLPPPLPPPKLFAEAKKHRHPQWKPARSKSAGLSRFWPVFAFLAFCLILLCIAVLSLWVESLNKRNNKQTALVQRIPKISTILPAASSTRAWSVLPARTAQLPEAEEHPEAEDEEDEDGRTSTTSATADDPDDQNEWKGQEAVDEQQQYGVGQELLAKWVADERIRKRLRLFEVRDRNSASPPAFPSARPLPLSSLSHNGVPVHPLQFQRLLRAAGVDTDSLVVLYDAQSAQQLWAHYALWICRLFGHQNSAVLLDAINANGTLAKLLEGLPSSSSSDASGTGTFRAQWQSEQIATFDDVLANFEETEEHRADIVDAQTEEEFDGRSPRQPSSASASAIFGHIRTALSVPVELLTVLSASDQLALFRARFPLSAQPHRPPVIVYDGFSSHRAAFVWAALRRANIRAALYFGAWPEWLVRAPDHLKVIPDE